MCEAVMSESDNPEGRKNCREDIARVQGRNYVSAFNVVAVTVKKNARFKNIRNLINKTRQLMGYRQCLLDGHLGACFNRF